MEVWEVNDKNYCKYEEFLNNIEGISLDKEVINNGSLLTDEDDNIIGSISFEVFGSIGLIRYFVFKKVIDEEGLLKLFTNLLKKAKEKDLKVILSFIENEDIVPIFEYLGFTSIDENLVYIGEKKLIDLKNKNAEVYCYRL